LQSIAQEAAGGRRAGGRQRGDPCLSVEMDRTGLLAMEMPIMHDGDRYEHVRDIGSGNFGVARLMRARASGELVAVKYIHRGEKVPPFFPSLSSQAASVFR
jgi:hypothetical protein